MRWVLLMTLLGEVRMMGSLDPVTLLKGAFDLSTALLSAYSSIETARDLHRIYRLQEELSSRIEASRHESLSFLTTGLPKAMDRLIFLHNLEAHLLYLERTHSHFIRYLESQVNSTDIDLGKVSVENDTLIDLARSVVSHEHNSIRDLLESVHQIVVGNKFQTPIFKRTPLFHALFQSQAEVKKKASYKEGMEKSAQEELYEVYHWLQLVQLRGHTMMQLAWAILRYFGKGNFRFESELGRRRQDEMWREQANSVKEVIGRADRMIWRSQPVQQVEELTYIQLTKLLQGRVVRQNLLQGRSLDECLTGASCDPEKYQGNLCQGDIIRCNNRPIEEMYICYSNNTEKRLYDGVRYFNPEGNPLKKWGYMGRYDFECAGRAHHLSRVSFQWWVLYYQFCFYCFCICDPNRDSSSHRYFNLRPSLTDISKNRVVTGVRLVKHNKVVHIQIEEGELRRDGHIDESTLNWKRVENYTVEDNSTRKNVDYHKMTYRQRSVDLDLLIAPPDYLLTGVKLSFKWITLKLQAQVTFFNRSTGLLDPNTTHWVMRPQPNSWPAERRGEDETRLGGDEFVEMEVSAEKEDVAQSTLPRLESQPVGSARRLPLTGLGLVLHNRPPRYIAPIVQHIDLYQLIAPATPLHRDDPV